MVSLSDYHRDSNFNPDIILSSTSPLFPLLYFQYISHKQTTDQRLNPVKMPENQPPAKKRRLPFKPPRPVASPNAGPSSSKPTSKTTKKNTTTAPTTSSSSKPRKQTTARRQPAQSPSRSPSASASPARDNDAASSPSSQEGEPEYILAEITTHKHNEDDILNSAPAIPHKLLTRLLHQHFQNEKTKITKDANEVVAKYVDTFVREALARAAFERKESNGETGMSGIDGFLEVCLFHPATLVSYFLGQLLMVL